MTDDNVDEASEHYDRCEGDEDRLPERPAVVVVEPEERNGADHDGDERRGTSQTAQLTREDSVRVGEDLAATWERRCDRGHEPVQ